MTSLKLFMKDIIKKEFSLRDDIAYLNHAGVSPWPVRTSEAVKEFAEENSVQGSLRYPEWMKVETALRIKAQKIMNAPSKDDIAFLKNTSEALSAVAYGLNWKGGDNIVSSNEEFPSNRIVWESLSRKGVEFREADLNTGPSPEDALFSLVDANTKLITISSIQFSTGLRLDLGRIGQFCKSRGILFCVDAIQSIGAVQFDVQKIHADFVMADGHKWMFGPEGLAVFYSTPEGRDRLQLKQYGWHMTEVMGDFDRRDWAAAESARRFECGSPNMLCIHALDASLSLLLEIGMEQIEQEVLKRSTYIFDRINSIPALKLITLSEHNRYGGIVTFSHGEIKNTSLYDYLMGNNVICAPRSGGIRFSPHFYTPYEHIDRALSLVMNFPE
jgi:selenocysteine lyase/cysteine desulfurase